MVNGNITQLSDMKIPEHWGAYLAEKSTQNNAFFTSGVVQNVQQIAALLGAGKVANMPLFKPLADNDPQVPDDTTDLLVNKITTDLAQARKLGFDQAWSATDLSAELSGADPLSAIGDQVSDYWSHIYEKLLLKTLTGVFSSVSMKGVNQLDATADKTDTTFSLKNFNKARFLLGDRYKDLAVVAVHSDVLRQLQDANLVDAKSNSTFVLNGNSNVPTSIQAPDAGDKIKGVQIVVDDSLPVSGAKYTSYLFARGAVGYSELPVANAIETNRDPLKNHGVDYLVNRRRFVFAPQGLSWNESNFTSKHSGKAYPTMDDLADGTNWSKVYDQKLIPMAQFVTSADPITTVSSLGH
ncbi:phage capsid protein [Lactiplantibacillus plantarum]|uniref:major capsid protein n=1 Tax=Lactiplantibacillus plantarum TaxID=1590 RepID=UPI0009C2A15E|nr:phage capsid protein [Lactiplantibacillus plantarum]MCG0635221.1 phage capsid protein [Lactiplantibacillus plantarum]MCG0641484.1 phage capsid protein [Lactiplantibacillus plantarum]MCG0644514.1 phage capsid protein [Lactiplantibacillus plantarum]MCG0650825.1 phage capsid protein [Lactiplantibacillus plantarum]